MDELDEPGWSRSEWARWWLDHDEPDEAARAVEPGDEVKLSRTDALDLAAALARRGLTASYESGVLFVSMREPSYAEHERDDAAAEMSPRRPPLRASTPVAHATHAGAKKSA